MLLKKLIDLILNLARTAKKLLRMMKMTLTLKLIKNLKMIVIEIYLKKSLIIAVLMIRITQIVTETQVTMMIVTLMISMMVLIVKVSLVCTNLQWQEYLLFV